jgi:hypothetical protein
MRAINWTHGLRWESKTKKWQMELDLHGTILEGKSMGSNPNKKELKRRAHDWRTKIQARVQLKDSICFKWVQIGSYEFGPGTNLGGGSSNCASTSIMSNQLQQPRISLKPPIKPTLQRKSFPLFFLEHWRGGMSKVNLRHKLFISSSYFLKVNSQFWKCNREQ